jgi:glycosyltransferase involved in cell wall biosynthesis
MNASSPPEKHRPLRISVVSAFPPSRTTLNEYGFHLVNALRKDPRVERVSVIADTSDISPKSGAEADTSRVWKFDSLLAGAQITREALLQRPDALVFNAHFRSFGESSLASALALLSAPVLSKLGIPTILILHNIVEAVDLVGSEIVKNRHLARLAALAGTCLTKVLLSSDRVSVLLPSYQSTLRSKYGAGNVLHIPHGVFGETPEAPFPWPKNHLPRALTFGKFGTYKRVEVLIEAAELLRRRSGKAIEVVVAGSDNPNRIGYLDSVRTRFAHVPDLRFTGYLEESAVLPTLASSDVVVLPYTSTTGSSGVLHQVGQVGRPAIMPAIGDLAELMETEGYRAETFEPDSAGSLAAALERVLGDEQHKRNLAQANFDAAKAHSMSSIASRYLDAIVGILPPSSTRQSHETRAFEVAR